MKNIVGIIREGISKKGERRVAITPDHAKEIVEWGHRLIVQPAVNPKTGEIKRAFPDIMYKRNGAEISEDLSAAKIIFGLKEVHSSRILPEKAYYFFSHTHKGQLKNRRMLKTLVDKNVTLIDYELITDENNNRLITAFGYNAGYAGMVDSLWTLGKRLKIKGRHNPFELISQSVEEEHLYRAKENFERVAHKIETKGTPKNLPPIIVCFLGKGKTAKGAREMFDILPHEEITIDQLKDIYNNGSHHKLYVLHISRDEIYRLKKNAEKFKDDYGILTPRDKRSFYNQNPELFESNLDKVLPYITVLMNCIIWSSKYPRTVTINMMKEIYSEHKTLQVIGDITCDPNGSIEFSKETWIDNPVYVYDPISQKIKEGFEGNGIAVMAVTNLPCEFSADASIQFSNDLLPFLKNIITANYNSELQDSGLVPEIEKAVLLWKGKFTERYNYMINFLGDV